MSGKMAKYSSQATDFSPVHQPVPEAQLNNMVSRLYTPQTLRRRTFIDQQQRRELNSRTAYDATQDAHLSAFWFRQQQLKEQLREERRQRLERIERLSQGATPASTPGSSAARSRATGAGSSKSPQRSRPTTQQGKRSANGPGVDGGGGSRRRRSSSSDSSTSDSSSVVSSPAWTVEQRHQKQAADDAASGQRGGGKAAEDPNTEHRHQRHLSVSQSSRSDSVSSRRSSSYSPSDSAASSPRSRGGAAGGDQTDGSQPSSPERRQRMKNVSFCSPGAEPLAGTPHPPPAVVSMPALEGDLKALPQAAWTLLAACFTTDERRALTKVSKGFEARLCSHHNDHQRPQQAALVPAAAEKELNSNEGAVVAVVDPEAELEAETVTIAPPITCLHRRDLTALWMIARPPPSYQAVMRRLGIAHGDFDLSWMLDADGMPPTGGTVNDIPLEADGASTEPQPQSSPDGVADDGTATSSARFSLSSPRSIVTVLRNGVTLSELVPRPLYEFYAEGKLEGKPEYLCDKRFTAHEKRRRATLCKVRADYARLCGDIGQPHLIDVLRSIDPNENPDYPIRHDGMAISEARKGSSSLTRKLSIIGSVAQHRTATAQELQHRRQEKFERHLQRNMELTMERVRQGLASEAREREKVREIAERRQKEALERRRRLQEKEARLQQVVSEGRLRAELRRQHILDKVAEHEYHWERKQRERGFVNMVVAEETRILKEQKRDNMARRERLEEYKKLCTLDRIRRKMDKARAAAESEMDVTRKLRQERERAAVLMRRMAHEHEEAVIAAQRREANNSPVNARTPSRAVTPSSTTKSEQQQKQQHTVQTPPPEPSPSPNDL